MLSRLISKRPLPEFLLFVCAFIWGLAFVAQLNAMLFLGPFGFSGLRFIIAGVVISPFAYISSKFKFSRHELLAGLILGIWLFVGSNLQQISLLYTTAGKSGFITSLYICFIPFFLLVFWRIRIRLMTFVGVIVATSGLALLCLQESFIPTSGDLWALGCAAIFALHVIYVGRYVNLYNPLHLAFIQSLVAGFSSFIIALYFEGISTAGAISAWRELLYAGGLSAGLAYTIQIVAQRYVSATNSALILSLEAIFAALAGWIFLFEVLNSSQIFGCILMLCGVLLAQIGSLPKSTNKTVSLAEV